MGRHDERDADGRFGGAFGGFRDTNATMAARQAVYSDMIGFVPPRVAARLAVTGSLDPDMLRLQEEARSHAMATACFEPKIVQLMIFGMLVVELSDAAMMHCVAARKAGATWEELQAVVSLAYLFRGLPAANRGAEILARAAEREASEADGEKTPGRVEESISTPASKGG